MPDVKETCTTCHCHNYTHGGCTEWGHSRDCHGAHTMYMCSCEGCCLYHSPMRPVLNDNPDHQATNLDELRIPDLSEEESTKFWSAINENEEEE